MKLPKLAWILDERLGADSVKTLLKLMATLKPFSEVTTFEGTLSQENIITALEKTPYQLVILPWYKYLAWKKVEAFFGLTRVSGPTVCGYFVEPIDLNDLPDLPDYPRFLMLDLMRMGITENAKIIHSLIDPKTRTGLRPLLRPTTPTYYSLWDGKERTSLLLEGFFELPEFSAGLKDRKLSISMALQALGHFYFSSALSTSGQVGFHAAADGDSAWIRTGIGLAQPPTSQMIQSFWLKGKPELSVVKSLYRYADFVRVQWSQTPHQMEITVGWMPSKSQEKSQIGLRSQWCEPTAPELFSEPLFVAKPSVLEKALPEITLLGSAGGAPSSSEAQTKIQSLQKQLHEKEMQLRELKAGGVATAMTPALPDEESLVEALKQRLNLHPEKKAEIQKKLSDLLK